MAEGFEPFHVPQQSRRDKLRLIVQNYPSCEEATATLQGCAGLLPLNDPSLLPSVDMLTCSNPLGGRRGGGGGDDNDDVCRQTPVCAYSLVKEGVNLIGYDGGFMNSTASSSSLSHDNHLYVDPYASLAVNLNPSSSIQDNNNPFLYTAQNLRDFDQSFNCEESQTTGKGLSLSLSSHHTHQHYLPLELSQPGYEPTLFFGEKGIGGDVSQGIITPNDVRSTVPLGPFTGYASILRGSSFLKPAQQLLEEFCDVGRRINVERSCIDSSLIGPPMENLTRTAIFDDLMACSNRGEHQRKDTRLISMLNEVYRRYKLYYQQMQAIVASFESVPGLGNAAPYTTFALKTMSKHFRCLKNAITDQRHFASKALDEGNAIKDEALRLGTTDQWVRGQRPILNLGSHENQPIWRPQRGLPEHAVAALRAWMFDHFLHPYPTDTDKQMLAKQTGLSRNQVSNWFINARVRLWKPMVEEIHMLETRQAQKASEVEDQTNSESNEPLTTANPPPSNNQTQINVMQKAHDHLLNRSRNELSHVVPDKSNELMNFYSNNLSNHHHVGFGIGTAGGSSGVSLTLGLCQNNVIGLSEPLSMDIDHHFGLEANNDGYVVDGFEAPNRHFRKDIEGQLLRDFVG